MSEDTDQSGLPASGSPRSGRRALAAGVQLALGLFVISLFFVGNPTQRLGGVAVFALAQFVLPFVAAGFACFLAAWALSDRVPRSAGLAVALLLLAAAAHSFVRCWPILLSA